MRDRRLSNLFDLVLAEVHRQTIRDCGGEIWEANGVVSWASSLRQASPSFANGVMRMNRLMSPRELLGIAARFFQVRGNGYTLMVRTDDRALRAEVERSGRGMSAERIALMLAEPPCEATARGEWEIRRVKNPTGMLDLCGVVNAALGPETARLVNLALRRVQALMGPTKAAYVLYEEGTAVACALTQVTQGVAFIGWICTHPDYRRRGMATEVTAAAVRAGFELGAGMAALLSPASVQGMATALGFEEVARYQEYVFAPPAG